MLRIGSQHRVEKMQRLRHFTSAGFKPGVVEDHCGRLGGRSLGTVEGCFGFVDALEIGQRHSEAMERSRRPDVRMDRGESPFVPLGKAGLEMFGSVLVAAEMHQREAHEVMHRRGQPAVAHNGQVERIGQVGELPGFL